MKFKILIMLIFLLILSTSVTAIIPKDSMKIYAVTSSGQAVSADLTLELREGNGNIWSDIEPLIGTTTQSAEKTAVKVAKNYSNQSNKLDYFFNIDSSASLVEGPSAGAAMALLTIAQLQDKQFPSNVSMTGTISEDGRVGAVGGVFEKSREASETGIKLFLIPKGEGRQTVRLPDGVQTIFLPEYAQENWNIKVVEVSDIDEAIKFAFSNIEEIDVNATGETFREFTPQAIQYSSSLTFVKNLTFEYINDVNVNLNQARVALSNSLIDDSATLEFLLSTLNSADRSLFQAKELYENNYLYSAANLSFLAKVYTSLVKDIAENPSMLLTDSTLFDIKVNELKQDITLLKNNLNQNVPLDMLEWHISSQQRVSWAELKINELTNQTIEISINGQQPLSSTEIALERIEDYEFALAWFDVAKDFYEETQNSQKKAFKSTMNEFEETPRQFIVQAENGLTTTETELEDAQRRLNASLIETKNGWHLAASVDAATALALIEAEAITKNKSQEELQTILEQKVSALENRLNASTYNNEWSHLYLDHSKYFLNSAKYFHEEGFEIRSSDNLRNGITLALFAEKTFEVMEPINSYYENLSPNLIISSTNGIPGTSVDSGMLELLLLLVLIAIFLLLFAVVRFVIVPKKELSWEKEMQLIDSLKKKVNQAIESGRISKEEHIRLLQKYSVESKQITKEFIQSSDYKLHLDLFKAEISGYKRSLIDLQKQLKTKMIPKTHFNQKLKELNKKIEELQLRVAQESKLLVAEKNKIKKIIEDLQKETQNALGKKKN